MLAPDASQVHHDWINALPPRLEVEPGDTVGFDTRNDADLHYTLRGRRRHKPASSSNYPVEDRGQLLGATGRSPAPSSIASSTIPTS